MHFPLYTTTQTFSQNILNYSVPTIPIPTRVWPEIFFRFLDYELASPIGVSACAITTGRPLAWLAQLGFDVLTYKTIRSRAQDAHPLPNILPVACDESLKPADLNQPLYVCPEFDTNDKLALANSFGNACFDPHWVEEDIETVKKSLRKGQILIVSVYGQGQTDQETLTDFVTTACIARDAGADIIELNLSCPNITDTHRILSLDSEAVYQITYKVVQCIKKIPVIVKLGLFPDQSSPETVLTAAARAGAMGISAINSVPMTVLQADQTPAFGDQRVSAGVSGYPIRALALNFIRTLAEINRAQKFELALLGMGGVTEAQHFMQLQEAGADVMLAATGVMWNPYLATQYHQQLL